MPAEHSSHHLKNKKQKNIVFNSRNDNAMTSGYVKKHLISHVVEAIWWEMLADIHTGCAALHMLACCPHNLQAIWWGASLSPCTSGTLVCLSH